MFIQSLNIGRPQIISNSYGQSFSSGIRKKPTPKAFLYKDGFENDKVSDTANHGGEERAVCFYPSEHYHHWNQFSQKELPVPAFGENITVENMNETVVCIGDTYLMGEAIVQITQSRIPCYNIDRFNQVNGLFFQFIQTGKTGYFAKVIEEGFVEEGESIRLLDRPRYTKSIAALNKLFFHDRRNKEEIEKTLLIEGLAESMKAQLQRLL